VTGRDTPPQLIAERAVGDEGLARRQHRRAVRAAHPLLEQGIGIDPQGIRAQRHLRRNVCGRQEGAGAVGPELLPPHPGQPLGTRVKGRRALRRRVVQVPEKVIGGRGAPQDGVHEAGAGAATTAAVALGELHGLVDGGVVGGGVGEGELVQAQAQRGEDRRVQLLGRAVGEPLDQVVGGAPSLDGAIREPLSLRALAGVEIVALGGRRERPIGPRTVLEDPSQDLVGGAPLRGDVRGATHPARVGAGCPRR
jgi:hypothetical protein